MALFLEPGVNALWSFFHDRLSYHTVVVLTVAGNETENILASRTQCGDTSLVAHSETTEASLVEWTAANTEPLSAGRAASAPGVRRTAHGTNECSLPPHLLAVRKCQRAAAAAVDPHHHLASPCFH